MMWPSFITSNMAMKIGIAVAAALIGISSYVVFNKPQDNDIEEASEYVIMSELGFDIDLSPTSKEK